MYLLMKLPVKIPAGDKDGNDPEQAGEKNVKGDEEQEKPPHWRHLASVLSSRHQIVRHDHRKLLAAIPSSHTWVLEMGEMGRYPPAPQVRRERLVDRRVHLRSWWTQMRRRAHVLRRRGPGGNIWWRETPGVHLRHLGWVIIVVGVGVVGRGLTAWTIRGRVVVLSSSSRIQVTSPHTIFPPHEGRGTSRGAKTVDTAADARSRRAAQHQLCCPLGFQGAYRVVGKRHRVHRGGGRGTRAGTTRTSSRIRWHNEGLVLKHSFSRFHCTSADCNPTLTQSAGTERQVTGSCIPNYQWHRHMVSYSMDTTIMVVLGKRNLAYDLTQNIFSFQKRVLFNTVGSE